MRSVLFIFCAGPPKSKGRKSKKRRSKRKYSSSSSGLISEVLEDFKSTCRHCGGRFSGNLRQHLRNLHPEEETSTSNRYVLYVCDQMLKMCIVRVIYKSRVALRHVRREQLSRSACTVSSSTKCSTVDFMKTSWPSYHLPNGEDEGDMLRTYQI